MSAAVPIGFNQELLRELRAGFAADAPAISERDLLGSRLCRYTGAGLYIYAPAIRDVLLDLLLGEPALGYARLLDIAAFLHRRAREQLSPNGSPELRDFFAAQMHAASAYLEPPHAVATIADELGRLLHDRQFSKARQFTRLIRSLALPLVFEENLLAYAAGLERLLSRDTPGAKMFFAAFGSPDDVVPIGSRTLPGLNALKDLVKGGQSWRAPTFAPVGYDVRYGPTEKKVTIPFRIGVMANFSGVPTYKVRPRLKDRKFIEISAANFDDVLRRMTPQISMKVADRLSEDHSKLPVSLEFHSLQDFEPARVIRQMKPLAELQALRDDLEETFARKPNSVVIERIGDLDGIIQRQVDAIVAAVEFSELEASWRGLHHLVTELKELPNVQIAALDVTLSELKQDYDRWGFTYSRAYELIRETGFGLAGGTPFAVVLGDYAFGRHPADVDVLAQTSRVAEAAFTLFLTAAAPGLLNLETFANLPRPACLSDMVSTYGFMKWNEFRQRERARFAGLVVPRMLMRPPYGSGLDEWTEPVSGQLEARHALWGNPVYALGIGLARSFAGGGWISGWKGRDTSVESPQPYALRLDGEEVDNWITDAGVSSTREQELTALGFIPLIHDPESGSAFWGQLRSAYQSETVPSLPWLLTICRLAHYIRAMARDKAAPGMTAGDFERYVADWIADTIDQGIEAAAAGPRSFGGIKVHVVPRPVDNSKWWAILQPDGGPDFVIDLSGQDYTVYRSIEQLQKVLAAQERSPQTSGPWLKVLSTEPLQIGLIEKAYAQRSMSYEFGTGDAPQPKGLSTGRKARCKTVPFVIGVLGDFAGAGIPQPPREEHRFVEVNQYNLDGVLKYLSPVIVLSISDRLTSDRLTWKGAPSQFEVRLVFKCLDDFEATEFVNQIEPLQPLLKSRRTLAELFVRVEPAEYPERVLTELLQSPPASDKPYDSLAEAIAEWKDQLLPEGKLVSVDMRKDLRERLAHLDWLISAQCREVLAAPAFRQLRSRWYGLAHLVSMIAENDTEIKIKLMAYSKGQLLREMVSSAAPTGNCLEETVFRQPRETFGADHFDVLIGDFEVGESSLDVDLLNRIGSVAARAHTPFLSAALPKFAEAEPGSSMRSAWERFRANVNARYVGLVANQWRVPRPKSKWRSVACFHYLPAYPEENEHGTVPVNAAYAVAALMMQCFLDDGWCGWLRTIGEGGTMKGRGEPELSVERQARYAAAGAMVLQSAPDGQGVGFPTLATASRRNGDYLARVLATGRIAHYLTLVISTESESVMSTREWESRLRAALRNYEVTPNPVEGGQGPQFLEAVGVVVRERPDARGRYQAVVEVSLNLKQLSKADERLVFDLPRTCYHPAGEPETGTEGQPRLPCGFEPTERIRLEYSCDSGPEPGPRSFPFTIGVLADLSGAQGDQPSRFDSRDFVEIDGDSFDHVVQAIEPRLSLQVENRLTEESGTLAVNLRFGSLADFEPTAVAMQVKPLKELLDVREKLARIRNSLLDGNERLVDLDTETMLHARIADIDRLVSEQLSQIFHAAEFQKLETAWRGLRYLVDHIQPGDDVKVRVMDVSKASLNHDFTQRPIPASSSLFKKVHDDVYASTGAEPFGLLLADFAFGNSSDDLDLLMNMSRLAADANLPFVGGVDAGLLGLADFKELQQATDLAVSFTDTDRDRWQSSRETATAQYVALALPRMLLRLPYSSELGWGRYVYEEVEQGHTGSAYLWGNSAYALAARVAKSYARYGWGAGFEGSKCGGLVEGLPLHPFVTDAGDLATTCPSEVAIGATHAERLIDLGLAPLVHWRDTDCAVFLRVRSIYEPAMAATESSERACAVEFRDVVAENRIAQYIKCIVRDCKDRYKNEEELQTLLNDWLEGYKTSASGGDDCEGLFREAHIYLEQTHDKSQKRRAVLTLRPYFQLNDGSSRKPMSIDLP